jgi:CubicO group peptidase (beta-lactamase class C family)
MKTFILFFGFLLYAGISGAQSVETDALVKKLMDTAHVTGLCLGMIKNNQVVFVKAYGYKNKPKGLLNDTSTCFYGASLSKAVFAYLALQLVDEGKLDLDKPLYQYLPKPLPDYEQFKDLAGDERWKLITGRMCLDHTTGFPNLRQFNNNKLEIVFKPGTRYAYSGEGINLLQFAVEIITGKPLEELATTHIFKPFGMTRTSYIWQSRFESDFANGHIAKEDTLAKRRRGRANAAGSMETTIADYTRFMAAVMQGKGLSKKMRAEMLRPQIAINSRFQFPTFIPDTADNHGLAYGLGWGLLPTPNGQAFFKEGHDDGWVHFSMGLPAKKEAYVVMCNASSGESIFKELFEKLSGITIPWYWEHYTPYNAMN